MLHEESLATANFHVTVLVQKPLCEEFESANHQDFVFRPHNKTSCFVGQDVQVEPTNGLIP